MLVMLGSRFPTVCRQPDYPGCRYRMVR
jgi:hypothetical protein